MEKNVNDRNGQDQEREKDLNVDSANSGSSSRQFKGNMDKAEKLSDYPDGNLDKDGVKTDTIPGNQTDQPSVDGKSIDKATDPSKLSEL